jgi:hypothetical protein
MKGFSMRQTVTKTPQPSAPMMFLPRGLRLKKKALPTVLGVIMCLVTPGLSQKGLASEILGKVTFVGTFPEDSSDGTYHARLRVRINGTCDSDTSVKDRWLIIRSGRMDGIYAHNAANMKNAYSTLTSALLSGKSVQIDYNATNCSTTSAINLDLWSSFVGMF